MSLSSGRRLRCGNRTNLTYHVDHHEVRRRARGYRQPASDRDPVVLVGQAIPSGYRVDRRQHLLESRRLFDLHRIDRAKKREPIERLGVRGQRDYRMGREQTGDQSGLGGPPFRWVSPTALSHWTNSMPTATDAFRIRIPRFRFRFKRSAYINEGTRWSSRGQAIRGGYLCGETFKHNEKPTQRVGHRIVLRPCWPHRSISNFARCLGPCLRKDDAHESGSSP